LFPLPVWRYPASLRLNGATLKNSTFRAGGAQKCSATLFSDNFFFKNKEKSKQSWFYCPYKDTLQVWDWMEQLWNIWKIWPSALVARSQVLRYSIFRRLIFQKWKKIKAKLFLLPVRRYPTSLRSNGATLKYLKNLTFRAGGSLKSAPLLYFPTIYFSKIKKNRSKVVSTARTKIPCKFEIEWSNFEKFDLPRWWRCSKKSEVSGHYFKSRSQKTVPDSKFVFFSRMTPQFSARLNETGRSALLAKKRTTVIYIHIICIDNMKRYIFFFNWLTRTFSVFIISLNVRSVGPLYHVILIKKIIFF